MSQLTDQTARIFSVTEAELAAAREDGAERYRQRLRNMAGARALELMASDAMPADHVEAAKRWGMETFMRAVWVQAFRAGFEVSLVTRKENPNAD